MCKQNPNFMTTESKNKVLGYFLRYQQPSNKAERPAQWIADVELTTEEKDYFLSLCRDQEEFSAFLDDCEKSHP